MIKSDVGVDCVDVARFDAAMLADTSLMNKIFTPMEISSSLNQPLPQQYFAMRFAGKEAVIKALSSFGEKVFFNEIEITGKGQGTGQVRIRHESGSQYRIQLSMSCSKELAIAYAFATKHL